MHPSCFSIDELEKECKWRFARRSGPGGQHRNKVESAAIVEHTPTGIAAEANERRSQADNRAVALWRLRVKLALAVRNVAEVTPGPAWQSHLQRGKIQVADSHVDLPAMLAELLDRLATNDWEISAAADWLGVSKSQVVKFLAQTPVALALVNERRAKRGMSRLRA